MKDNISESVKVTNALAKEIQEQFCLQDVLYLCCSSFGIFDEISKVANTRIITHEQDNLISDDIVGNTVIGDPYVVLDNLENSYDFIVGDLPLGLSDSKWDDEPQNQVG